MPLPRDQSFRFVLRTTYPRLSHSLDRAKPTSITDVDRRGGRFRKGSSARCTMAQTVIIMCVSFMPIFVSVHKSCSRFFFRFGRSLHFNDAHNVDVSLRTTRRSDIAVALAISFRSHIFVQLPVAKSITVMTVAFLQSQPPLHGKGSV